MRVHVIECGPLANESERKAIEYLKRNLRAERGEGEWVLLTNLVHSSDGRGSSGEIDIIAIGPPGVRVIEVKHWTGDWAKNHPNEVDAAANLVMSKARRIATSLRRHAPDLGYVAPVILLTQEAAKVRQLAGTRKRDVEFLALSGWKKAINLDGGDARALSASEVQGLARRLEPRSGVALDGSLRRLADCVNLELETPKEKRFHRIYRGSHRKLREPIILHLYDLSASDDKNAEARAEREFRALLRLQQYAWAPRILDSFQDAPGYPGEMFFFTLSDPSAPTLEQRAEDQTWETQARLEFARRTFEALAELHRVLDDDHPLIHRNLSPRTILVRHDNGPIFKGFELAKIASDVTVASSSASGRLGDGFVAPEVVAAGLGAADARSDVYSLCASLAVLFRGASDDLSLEAAELLERGLSDDQAQRSDPAELIEACGPLLGESPPQLEAPPARYWTEGQTIDFNGRPYRIVSRLGSGGIGTAFKVVEVDPFTKEDLGTYVAKVIHDQEGARRILRSYKLARPHLSRHPGLSVIFEIASEWRKNQPTALLTWVDGEPMEDHSGPRISDRLVSYP